MKFKLLLIFGVMLCWGLDLSAVELKFEQKHLIDPIAYQTDYIFLGEHLEMSGTTKDLFFLAEIMDFSGSSDMALTGVAKTVNVTGRVKNGVKAAGGQIQLDGNIQGTCFLVGEKVTFGKNSQRVGDSFAAGGKVYVLGKHRGNLNAAAAEVLIENEIQGDVHVYAGRLKISEQGRIIGNLTYHSDQELSALETSRVTGTVTFEVNEDKNFFDRSGDHASGGLFALEFLFKVAFIVFGLLILLFPVNRFLETRYSNKEIQSLALWGLLPIFIYPSAFIASVILVITLPLAATMALAFIPLVFVTKLLGLTLIGGYLANRFNLKTTSRFMYFLIGAGFYSLISFIPFVGVLLLLAVSSIGWGFILFALLNKKLT